MSESKTIQVPLEIPQPQQPTAEKPAWAAKSLHNVKMSQHVVKEAPAEPQWGQNPDGSARLSWGAPTPEPESAQPGVLEHAHAQLNNLQNGADALRQYQINGGDNQSVGEFSAPDPTQYDFWDEQSTADFQRANTEFILKAVAEGVNLALQPHREAMQVAQHGRDFNALAAEHGEDPRFQATMKAALQLMAEDPQLPMPKAFEMASDPKNAKMGAKGNANPPAALTTGKKAIGNLGKILFHNNQTERAVPYPKKRGW